MCSASAIGTRRGRWTVPLTAASSRAAIAVRLVGPLGVPDEPRSASSHSLFDRLPSERATVDRLPGVLISSLCAECSPDGERHLCEYPVAVEPCLLPGIGMRGSIHRAHRARDLMNHG
jgi:hypothetical protein